MGCLPVVVLALLPAAAARLGGHTFASSRVAS